MKFILHIGTHKTGTSSIQNFCARNQAFLKANGVSYDFDEALSAGNANFLGAYLVKGRHREIQRFIQRGIEKANRARLDRILLSGESLFGMTTSFPEFGAMNNGTYWDSERRHIEDLRQMLSNHDVTVVCYLRRQDRFLESLYSQMVMSEGGFAGPIDEFAGRATCMLDYYRHLEAWADCFGDAALRVRVFERAKNTVPDFMKCALWITQLPAMSRSDIRVNTRVARDLLEFKREVNTVEMGRVECFFATKALTEIGASFSQDNYDILTLERRKALLENVDASNSALARRWMGASEAPFPALNSQAEDRFAYPGLTHERRELIRSQFDRFMARPSTRFEIRTRNLLRAFEGRFPVGKPLVDAIRRLAYRRQLVRESRAQN